MAKKEATEKKEQKITAPAVQQAGGLPVTVGAADGAWGGEQIGNDDILIPKLLLMQPMSELVTDGIAKIGEFRSSLETDKVLADDKNALNVIIFGSFKNWLEFKDGEYLTTKPFAADNASLPREEILPDGSVMTRTLVLNYYGLNVTDIEKGEPFPFVLAFKSTSMTAGKTIGTHIKKLQMFKKPSAAKVFQITSKKEQNDKGTFFVPTVTVGRDSTQAELVAAYEWYKVLSKAKVRVDDSDVAGDIGSDRVVHQDTTAQAQATQ